MDGGVTKNRGSESEKRMELRPVRRVQTPRKILRILRGGTKKGNELIFFKVEVPILPFRRNLKA